MIDVTRRVSVSETRKTGSVLASNLSHLKGTNVPDPDVESEAVKVTSARTKPRVRSQTDPRDHQVEVNKDEKHPPGGGMSSLLSGHLPGQRNDRMAIGHLPPSHINPTRQVHCDKVVDGKS